MFVVYVNSRIFCLYGNVTILATDGLYLEPMWSEHAEGCLNRAKHDVKLDLEFSCIILRTELNPNQIIISYNIYLSLI